MHRSDNSYISDRAVACNSRADCAHQTEDALNPANRSLHIMIDFTMIPAALAPSPQPPASIRTRSVQQGRRPNLEIRLQARRRFCWIFTQPPPPRRGGRREAATAARPPRSRHGDAAAEKPADPEPLGRAPSYVKSVRKGPFLPNGAEATLSGAGCRPPTWPPSSRGRRPPTWRAPTPPSGRTARRTAVKSGPSAARPTNIDRPARRPRAVKSGPTAARPTEPTTRSDDVKALSQARPPKAVELAKQIKAYGSPQAPQLPTTQG